MQINRWLIIVLFSAALIGFADSAYLTAQHIRDVIPPCVVLNNCELVLTSKYASVGPVPVSALGILYYGTLLVLLIAYLDVWNRRILHWACWLVSAGMLASLYFVYVQLFILGALCPYCLISTLMTLILFSISVYIMRID
ncbi:MAG: vitamin K epoxide reductase family protein [Patescibacteria group bacterium]